MYSHSWSVMPPRPNRPVQLDEEDRKCADCSVRGPSWASLGCGIWICLECAGRHRNLGVHISLVRSIHLDSWNDEQVHRMTAGGNRRWRQYREYQGIPSGTPASILYPSAPAMAYKNSDMKSPIPYMGFPPPPVRWDKSRRPPWNPTLPPNQPAYWHPNSTTATATTTTSTSGSGTSDQDDDWGSFVSATPTVPTVVPTPTPVVDPTDALLRQIASDDKNCTIHISMARTLRSALITSLQPHIVPDLCAIIALYLAPRIDWKVNDDLDFLVPSCYLLRGDDLWKEAYITTINPTSIDIMVRSDDYFRHPRDRWLIRVALLPTSSLWKLPRATDIGTGAYDTNPISPVPRDRYFVYDRDHEATMDVDGNANEMMASYGRHARQSRYEYKDNPCWSDDALIMMHDGQYQRIDTLIPGDRVRSPIVNNTDGGGVPTNAYNISTIMQVITSPINDMMPMVKWSNGMTITRGHPMYVVNPSSKHESAPCVSSSSSSSACVYDWWRPDELVATSSMHVTSLYNLVLDGSDHTVLVNDPPTICCTIGRDCGDRLRRLHPHHHTKYGPSSLPTHDDDDDDHHHTA